MPWIKTQTDDGVDVTINTDRYDTARSARNEPKFMVLNQHTAQGYERETFIRETMDTFLQKVRER